MPDVRWGILEAAKFAREFMGPALTLAPGGHVVALAASDPAKAEPFRAFAPGMRVHPTFEALLADPEIDAVCIPLPNPLHVAVEPRGHALRQARTVRKADGSGGRCYSTTLTRCPGLGSAGVP